MEKEKICGIYCIENLANGKKYIGLSTDVFRRMKKHRQCLNGGYHINEHLQSAWDKYGDSNFSFYIVEPCKESELKSKEIYYIQMYKSQNRLYGYNKTSGGDGVKDLSDECAEKISMAESKCPVVCLSMNGDFLSEHRNCRVAANYVGGHAEDIRACCDKKVRRKSHLGFIWMYKEDYDKNGFNILDHQKSNCSKKIDVYDLYGSFIGTFDSARIVEEKLGIPYRNVSQVCKGQKRQSHGYICRFRNEPFDKFPVLRKDGKIIA